MNLGECLSFWGLVINIFQDHQCSYWYESAIPNESFQILHYLKYFFSTNLLEFPFYYLLLKNIKTPVKNLKEVVILNLSSHPFVFIFLPMILIRLHFNYLQYLIIAEVIAPTVEILILKYVFKYSWKISLAAAIIANIASWSIGVYLI